MNNLIIIFAAVLATASGANLSWRIVGGQDAPDGQFPHQVSIRYRGSHNCGGSILNKRWILTAAHCALGYNPGYLTILVGTNSLKDTKSGDIYQVKTSIAHEGFDFSKLMNDVGLMEVDKDIVFNDKVQPIEVNTASIGGGRDVTLSGWGTTSYPGAIPDWLQFIDLKSISVEECQAIHKNPKVHDSQICTFTKAGEGACHGDSGGALVFEGRVAGIVSWGSPCAKGYPDVFTRVSSFTDWINKNMS